jgi:beta-glucosidase
MPYTYPKHPGALVTYDHKPCEQTREMAGNYNYDATVDVQWPFGYGLHYAQVEYSDMEVDMSDYPSTGNLVVRVAVRNLGDHPLRESVLLYASDLVASLTPDVRRLCAFYKVELQPGEKRFVAMRVDTRRLAFVGLDGQWTLEPGDFRFAIADQSVVVNVK